MRELICPSALQQAFVVITRRTVELFVDASKVDHIADGGRQTRCLLFSSYGGGVVVVAINRSLACSALTLVAALEGITIRMYSSIYRFGWLIWGGGVKCDAVSSFVFIPPLVSPLPFHPPSLSGLCARAVGRTCWACLASGLGSVLPVPTAPCSTRSRTPAPSWRSRPRSAIACLVVLSQWVCVLVPVCLCVCVLCLCLCLVL